MKIYRNLIFDISCLEYMFFFQQKSACHVCGYGCSFIFHIRGPISSANGSIGTLNMNDASPAVHLLTFFLPSCYHSGCNACVLHGGADGGATLSGQLDPLALSCPFTHWPICEACASIIMLWLVSFSAMAYQGDTVQPLYTRFKLSKIRLHLQ